MAVSVISVACLTAAVAAGRPPVPILAKGDPVGPVKPVPFKLAKPDKPLLLLETTVNGKGPFRFVLDTGAGGTIVSPELAKKLNIKPDNPEKPEQATGAGGTLKVHAGTLKSFKVGEKELRDLKVGIMDLSGISKAIETDIDGIIGYNFLKGFRVTIDYPKQTVTFE
jgi:predicted aspartyl protease